jgi:hypothetical protein
MAEDRYILVVVTSPAHVRITTGTRKDCERQAAKWGSAVASWMERQSRCNIELFPTAKRATITKLGHQGKAGTPRAMVTATDRVTLEDWVAGEKS